MGMRNKSNVIFRGWFFSSCETSWSLRIFVHCGRISRDVGVLVRCRFVFHKNLNNYILEFLVKEVEKDRQMIV